MNYQTHLIKQIVGEKTQGAISLDIECLEDLDVTIDQLFEELSRTGDASLLEERCPYFGKIWPSAVALSEMILEKSAQFTGATVLELGCGLAIPSLVAAKLGAQVTATDFHPDVPVFLERNLIHNQTTSVTYEILNWARSADSPLKSRKYDWVVGSDVLYEKTHGVILAKTLSQLQGSGHLRALIADPGRPYLQGFTEELKRHKIPFETLVRREIFIISIELDR